MSENKGKLKAMFLVPSIIGVLLFMIPVYYNDSWTILVKILADMIAGAIGGFLPILCVIVLTVSAVMSLIGLTKPKFIMDNAILKECFSCGPIWTVIRVLGCVFVWITYLELGAGTDNLLGMISGGDQGGFVLYDLLTTLVIITAIAAVLLPLLTDFGLLEYVGALLTKVMRPLFKVPGRAAVDCVTSWIGDGTLGVLLTRNQYVDGYYSAKEAAIIATTFSAVSITFSLTVLDQVGLLSYFGVYYLTICLVGVICAIICPRLPPLSLKKSTYLVEGNAMPETVPAEYKSSHQYGMAMAMERVAKHKGVGAFFSNGLKNAASMWFGCLPGVMCIGTAALIVVNYTPIFNWLGVPFQPLFELFQVPDAAAAASTMIVGFTDMFTPAIIISGVGAAPITCFIVAVISVTQVLYLSEVGGLLLGSELPINLPELFIIFLERTIISIVIVCPIAHLIF